MKLDDLVTKKGMQTLLEEAMLAAIKNVMRVILKKSKSPARINIRMVPTYVDGENYEILGFKVKPDNDWFFKTDENERKEFWKAVQEVAAPLEDFGFKIKLDLRETMLTVSKQIAISRM